MPEIKLNDGSVALVDDDDYASVSQYRWHVKKWKHHRYARSTAAIGQNGKKARRTMHQFIMGGRVDLEIDHINGNGLDNRRSNLRLVTTALNQANQNARRGGTSKYRGVHYAARDKKWRAAIVVAQKKIALGRFDSEEAAARAYDGAALYFWGEYANVNFQDSVAIVPVQKA